MGLGHLGCLAAILTAGWLAVAGCAHRHQEVQFGKPDLGHYQQLTTEIEYPAVETCLDGPASTTPAPITLHDQQLSYRDITLHEAIHTALTTADVLRNLRGLVLENPAGVRSIHDPAIIETDPIEGIEAALSAFDASFATRAYFEKNDRALNNVFFGGGTRLLQQDLHHYTAELTKPSATGANFALRHNVAYDFNNSPGNDIPNRPWDANLEAEFRQPLLQGAGVEFNRIAGPLSLPGRPRGVLIARLNTDIGLTDFEMGVRDFVSDVEDAYWELYYAYRDLDAKIAARNRALDTWRRVHSLFVNNRRGGEAEAEAQAREQFFRFQEEVENAFGGRRLDHGRHEAFQGLGGVQSNERRLRRLLGLPISDGQLLRPVEEPTMARMVFAWEAVLCESLVRRAELRRQQWLIRRHELDCVAAKNFLKPRLDAIGRYRFRGLGSDLLDPQRSSVDRFDNAYQNLTSGEFQEWHLGVELTAPLGFRQAHAAVRNAELRLARTRAVYDEQQREIVHDLSSSFADLERSYTVSQTNLNRMIAAQQQLDALEALDDNEKPRRLDLLLDAQKRMADAESRYHRSLIEHTLAIKAVHLAKGSLLDYDEVHLTEGCWPEPACVDVANREARRGCPLRLTDYRMARSPLVSAGVYAQDALPVGEDEMP